MSGSEPQPRVAIACSGLGSIRRGNETWAQSVAQALYGDGAQVTLLGGGPLGSASCPYFRMRCVPREAPVIRRCFSWHHRYILEQLTATASLKRYLTKHDCDIVHVPDPDLALQIYKRTRETPLRVVFKDGQFLGPRFCSRFQYVQVLAPHYLDLARQDGIDTSGWHLIPHLVDVHRFLPPGDKARARARWLGEGATANTLIVLAVGDFSASSNKRLDWVVQEFSRFQDQKDACLFLAGQATDAEFAQFSQAAKRVLGERVRLFRNLEADEMAGLYQAADVLAHAALREPFGIVFLEAMSCGLPIVAHRFPVTEWVVGDAGRVIDMEAQGELASVLKLWSNNPDLRRGIGERARERALATFAEERVLPMYREMYRRIMAGTR